MYRFGIFVFVVCILYTTENVRSNYILSINANSISTKMSHFWKSTGFCPPKPRNNISKYLLSNDVLLNIALIGAIPNQGIKQVRIHWLLDLVQIKFLNEFGTPVYDFKYLDSLFDWLHKQHLYPGFEIMGNPSSYFINFLELRQKKLWQELIREIAVRYTNRYGVKYVSKWRFETWNEPDLKLYNILNLTLPSYISYVNASAAGLKFAAIQLNTSNKFKFGGPAGLFKSKTKHLLCWGIISECAKQGSTECPLRYISFHKKGDETASGVLNKGLELIQNFRNEYPNLNSLPIANDEADILTGWSKSREWRADVRYAAMVVKVIIDHYNKFIKELNIKIEVLSNDNAFLNYYPYFFTQRTLLARFQMNNTIPPHIQFFKKPVYTVMALLSYLGSEAINSPINENFSYFATTSNKNKNKIEEYSIILSYVNDTKQDNLTKTFEITVKNLPNKEFIYVVYILNNILTNPYQVWKNNGCSYFPNSTLRQEIRSKEGPYRLNDPIKLHPGENCNIKFNSYLPTVALLHICSKSKKRPGKVINIQLFNVTRNEVIIMWNDHQIKSKCILSYEIEFAEKENKNVFQRINQQDVIFLWYQFVPTGKNATTYGSYRIRATDYWGISGPYSEIIKYP